MSACDMYYCRLRLVQEKAQLLRELRNSHSTTEAEFVSCRIRQLEHDLQQAVDYDTQQFDTNKYIALIASVC